MKYFILFFLASCFFSACSSDRAENKIVPQYHKIDEHYLLAAVEKTGVVSEIKLPGSFAAYQEVSIFPKVNGYVKTVLVDIGSRVKKGNLLMELEASELEQASTQAREKWARAKTDYALDKERFLRLTEASETPGAISPLDLSIVKSKMEADSVLANAEKSNWQMQETMQEYLKVRAPFDGVITQRNVHPGALVSASSKDSKPMLELKDISHLRLKISIPENVSGSLRAGDTISFFTSAAPGLRMSGTVSRKSMNMDAQYRSELLEADVINKENLFAPGMYADVLIRSKGNATGFKVPKTSLVTSTERKYVFLVRRGKITKQDVSSGNESDQFAEVYGDFHRGDSVIVHANDEIREGAYY